MDFGTKSLSHPLLVEAAEELFVPVCVYNNAGGPDAAVLEKFGEPAWNNPVVRFLAADERDLLPRAEGLWTVHALARRMAEALRAAGRPAPGWLEDCARATADTLAAAVFQMHCFWEGEARLGALPGVLCTRAGYVGPAEVVEVAYDPALLTPEALERAARECSGTPLTAATPTRPAPEADQWHHLRQSPLRPLPLTANQATKVNAALAAGEDPAPLLSPRQLALGEAIRRVLESDPAAFDDLHLPAGEDDLGTYEEELRRRLR